MLFIGMMQWWYTTGWKIYLNKFQNRLRDAADFFSIRLLVTNLFAPFRQISATTSNSPALSAQISAFFDRLISRLIGTVVRLILLVIGLIVLLVQTIIGLALMIVWPFAPFLFIVCIILTIMQVTF